MKQPVRPILNKNGIEHCHELVDKLVKLYAETDPVLGEKSEKHKMEKALQALKHAADLTGILTEWAEAEIFGHYFHRSEAKGKTEASRPSNSHLNELIWYDMTKLSHHVNEFPLEDYRTAVITILSHVHRLYGITGAWRVNLRESLHALNYGQVYHFVTPTHTKQQGDAYRQSQLKWVAIQHVYRLWGERGKKMAAQYDVAKCCGVTFDAIKKWEKPVINEWDKEKTALEKIKQAAKAIAGMKKFMPDFDEQVFLDYAQLIQGKKRGRTPKDDLAQEMALCIRLTENYPLNKLKEQFVAAGARTSD